VADLQDFHNANLFYNCYKIANFARLMENESNI
jgi:hypothetical protein